MYLVALCILPLLSGCDDGTIGSPARSPFQLYVHIESASGTNVLDSLQVSPEENTQTGFKPGEDSIVVIKCIRNSDQKELQVGPSWLNCRLLPVLEEYAEETGELGRILQILWVDDDVWNTERKTKRYDESYTVYLSGSVFGKDKIQTITGFIHVRGTAYVIDRYEVNGKAYRILPNSVFNSAQELSALIKLKTDY